jgi:Cu-Zn family superoxide dismutase
MKARIARSSGALVVAALAAGLLARGVAHANPIPTFAAYVVDPKGAAMGTVTFIGVKTDDGHDGVQIRAELSGLPPGKHGFHLHETGSCNALTDTTGKVTPFGAAGGHFDPQGTGHHLGPNGEGHAGDFANLNVDSKGNVRTTFFTDRLTVVPGPADIVGRAVIIHANEDNYTDTPTNGGSGARIACGEIGPLRVQ